MSMKFNTCHFASARRAWWISRSLLVWLYARYCTRHGWRFHSGITGYNRRYSVEKIENSTDVTGFHTNVGAPREAAMTALTTMNIPAAQRAFEVLPKWLELDFVKQLWVGNESIISSRIFWIIRMNEWMNPDVDTVCLQFNHYEPSFVQTLDVLLWYDAASVSSWIQSSQVLACQGYGLRSPMASFESWPQRICLAMQFPWGKCQWKTGQVIITSSSRWHEF